MIIKENQALLKHVLKLDNYHILPCSEWECKFCECGEICEKT